MFQNLKVFLNLIDAEINKETKSIKIYIEKEYGKLFKLAQINIQAKINLSLRTTGVLS